MIIVYVWDFKGKDEAWGHASMKVQSYYISWWPEKDGRVRNKIYQFTEEKIRLNRKLREGNIGKSLAWIQGNFYDIYSVMPIFDRNYKDDVRGENNREADHKIVIEGLDESKIISWWQRFAMVDGFQGPPLPWSTLTMNCSNVVAKALEIGGGDEHATWHKSINLIWKPDDVLSYAQSIKDALDSKTYGVDF